LFPPVAPVRAGWRSVLMWILAFVVGTVAVLLRQTGPGALDTIYAEDGQVFLQQLYDLGLVETLWKPYAGYSLLASRVLVAPVGAMAPSDAAAGLAVAAAATTALLALLAYRALQGHIRSWPLRAAAAAAVVLLPAGQEEAWNVVANVHWFLVPVAALLLLFDPTSRVETAVAAAVVFVTAASDPIALALLPLAAVRLLATLPRRTRVVPLALGAGLAFQALAVARGAESRGTDLEPMRNPVKLALWWVYDIPGRTLVGTRWMGDIDAGISWSGALVGLTGLAVLGWLAIRHLDRRDLLVPAALVVTGALLYAVYAGLAGARPPRYAVPAGILLVVAVAVVLDRLGAALDATAARRLLVVAGAAVVLVWGANYRIDTSRSEGPRWSEEIDAARLRCDGPDDREQLAVVPGSPWAVEVDCRELG
jgi:hypothetical protein